MLVSLPIAAFAVTFLLGLGWPSRTEVRGRDWRAAFLEAAVPWGFIVVAITESLSLFGAVKQPWLALSWALVLSIVITVGIRSRAIVQGWKWIAELRLPPSWAGRSLLIGLASIALVLFTVAWVSPPNNVDSFIYHMTRVVNWAQNGSLSHYPAAHESQLTKPIWAETAILNLRVMWGSDRPANLVQWFSMVGSLIGVSKLAELLGVGRRSQLIASTVAAAIPMGILQATSTQNDYVVAFWVVCLAYYVLLSRARPLSGVESTGLALSVGLGVLTKGTFFVYAVPLLAWHFLVMVRRLQLRRLITHALAIGVAVGALNFGFWARNVRTFGGPYGTQQWLRASIGSEVSFQARLNPAPSTHRVGPGSSSALNPGGESRDKSQRDLLARVSTTAMDLLTLELWTVGRNLTAPVGFVHQGFVRLFESLPGVFGPGYAMEMRGAAWNHEDTAGNPIHLALVPASVLILLTRRRNVAWKASLEYCLAALATFALIPVVIGHGIWLMSVRYQLPFFVIWAPLVATAIWSIRWPRLERMFAGTLMLASLPWVLLNYMRPLIGVPPWPTAIESILVVDRAEVLFSTNPGLRDDYEDLTELVNDTSCRTVGLRIDNDIFEYPFWWLLQAPESGFRLSVINVKPLKGAAGNPDPSPCAVVCSICGDRAEFEGLIRVSKSDSMSLFIDESYLTPPPGKDRSH